MNTLKRGSKGMQVKIAQALLKMQGYNIGTFGPDKNGIDGSYGSTCVSVVKKLQVDNGLYTAATVTGILGPKEWKILGVLMPYNTKIMTLKIPFSKIKKAQILLHNGKKNTVASFAKESRCNFVANAGMFDMKTMRNVQDLIIKGVVDNGGNYTDIGIAMCNDRNTGCMYKSKTSLSQGKPVDFIGASPTLIVDGVAHMDMKGLTKSYATQVTKRVCFGVDDKNFYYMITLNNCNLKAMQDEGLKQGIKTLINEDGGGSQSLNICGTTCIYTDGRGIASALGLVIA